MPEGALRATLSVNGGGVRSLAFSPDGKLLASGSVDGSIKLWSVFNNTLMAALLERNQRDDYVTSLAFSPSGLLLASGHGLFGKVRLWSIPDGTLKATLSEGRHVKSVAFSPDGLLLASGYDNDTIKLRSMPDGKVRKTLYHREVGDLHYVLGTGNGNYNPASYVHVTFSPDGNFLATGRSYISEGVHRHNQTMDIVSC